MAQHRTKAYKQQVQVKREAEAISYRLPGSGQSTPSRTPLKPASSSPAVTESLLRQPLASVYRDLVKTGIVSACIVLILILVVRFA